MEHSDWWSTYLLKKIGFDAKYANATLLQFAAPVRNAADAALNGAGLYIYGNTGVGKTHLASAVIRAIVQKMDFKRFPEEWQDWNEIVAINNTELFRNLRRAIQRKEDTFEITDRLCTVGVLVLDDLGSEQATAYTIGELYGIIDYRDRKSKQTIITSNLSLGDVTERFGDRIASRIAGMCKGIHLLGPDRRLKKEG